MTASFGSVALWRLICGISFAALLGPAVGLAQPFRNSEPRSAEWIVQTFFTSPVFPNSNRYYSGEMLAYIGKPTMGRYADGGYATQRTLLEDKANRRVYRFTYIWLKSAKDWYAYLEKRADGWKLTAVRCLAVPMAERAAAELAAKVTRSAAEDKALRQLRLVLSDDEQLRTWGREHRASLAVIAGKLRRGELVREDIDVLNLSSGSVDREQRVLITVGGILDNCVGFLHVPPGGEPPAMDAISYILVEPIGDSWFLYKTT